LILITGVACAPKPQTASVKIVVDFEKTEDHAEYPGEFASPTIFVKKGTAVTWTNTDAKEHTVTGGNGLFNQKLAPGASFVYTFKDSGNFSYRCELFHEMTGNVIVE